MIQIYKNLLRHYGQQDWWPAETPFEVMVGAILTQNTAWPNVEKAINSLNRSQMLTPEAIVRGDIANLAEALKPSGYFNIKAERLRNYCYWYLERGGLEKLSQFETE